MLKFSGSEISSKKNFTHQKGYYEKIRTIIGVRPGGHYISEYSVSRENKGPESILLIKFITKECAENLPLIEIEGDYKLKTIKVPGNSLIVLYEQAENKIQISRYFEKTDSRKSSFIISYLNRTAEIDFTMDAIEISHLFYSHLDIR